MDRDIRLYWLWLQQRLGRGNVHTAALLREFEHPRRLWEASAEELQAHEVHGALTQTLKNRSLDEAARILDSAREKGFWILTPDDERYPESLLSLPDLPLVLLGQGDWPDDWDRQLSLTVVGTRRISDTGRSMTAILTAGLVAGGAAIVTGAAPGADETALETAVDCHGLCVSVMACGLDVNYPPETAALRQRVLENGGILLSEYAPGQTGGKGCYPIRNRLLSGLTWGTLVTEAPARSGALLTAHLAREQGRDVYAVPGDMIRCAGCHRLIREGAVLVTDSAEILQEYFPRLSEMPDIEAVQAAENDIRRRLLRRQPPEKGLTPPSARRETVSGGNGTAVSAATAAAKRPQKPPMPDGLSPAAQALFALLTDKPQPMDELAMRAGLPPAVTLAALTELEMTGCVQGGAGGQYGWKG